jgi:hypothetical protein
VGLRGEYLHNAKVRRMPLIYTLTTATEIVERGISGKDVADYKGRDRLRKLWGTPKLPI